LTVSNLQLPRKALLPRSPLWRYLSLLNLRFKHLPLLLPYSYISLLNLRSNHLPLLLPYSYISLLNLIFKHLLRLSIYLHTSRLNNFSPRHPVLIPPLVDGGRSLVSLNRSSSTTETDAERKALLDRLLSRESLTWLSPNTEDSMLLLDKLLKTRVPLTQLRLNKRQIQHLQAFKLL
jgi:hypothetical protein